MDLLARLKDPHIWKRIVYERLTEPLHLNLLSLPVALFGSFRLRVAFDLVVRHHNAFAILKAADLARSLGLRKMTILEFGVAKGGGLMNMCAIAKRVTAITGVSITVVGFDTGTGMPPARDFRDHPDLYGAGDFAMDVPLLRKRLPDNGRLILGDIATTVAQFLRDDLRPECPIGYVAIDVDYYYSAVSVLQVFESDARHYLPITYIYLDDIELDSHNPSAGELLAVDEFNRRGEFRKIYRNEFLENQRLFCRPVWLKHIYHLHVMDHPLRSEIRR
jgi:hypothetical protein